jgi:hypothetical protein
MEGVYRTAEKIEGRSRIGEKSGQNHVKNREAARTYLEPIRNGMQKPIEGLLANAGFSASNKGGVDRQEQSCKAYLQATQ